jgi:hypothetical protein
MHAEGRQDREIEAAPRAASPDLEAGAGKVVEAVAYRTRIVGTRRRQRQALADALEQGDADLLFQHFDLAADRRMGEREFLGCGRGGTKPVDGFERQQGTDRGQEPARHQHVRFSPTNVPILR